MANSSLLSQFLKEECTPYVRNLICTELKRWEMGNGAARRQFEFNRFEIRLDFDEQSAMLEDVLDAAESGMQKIPLQELIAALGCTWPIKT